MLELKLRDKLAGLLPAVISGGRPKLASRLTRRLLSTFDGITANPVWIVRSDQIDEYESDEHEIVSYDLDWAIKYAASHWTHTEPPQGERSQGGKRPAVKLKNVDAGAFYIWTII